VSLSQADPASAFAGARDSPIGFGVEGTAKRRNPCGSAGEHDFINNIKYKP
jgi:hypothetical protein